MQECATLLRLGYGTDQEIMMSRTQAGASGRRPDLAGNLSPYRALMTVHMTPLTEHAKSRLD